MGRKSEYYYDGMSLKEYCVNNALNYHSILFKINELKKEDIHKGKSKEEIIEIALNQERKVRYKYKGKNLTTYCKENNLNVNKIRQKIIRLRRKYKDYSDERLVELALEKQSTVKYSYDGKKLSEYCKENNIKYRAIRQRIYLLREKEEFKECNDNELIELALNMNSRIKYYYEGKNLSKYCKENSFSLSAIYSYIFKIRKNIKYKDYNDDQIAELAVQNYVKEKNKKEIQSLLNKKKISDDNLEFICDYFNINKKNVIKLSELVKWKKAIYMVYYFGDKSDRLGNKIITKKKIDEILKTINEINKVKDDNYDIFSLKDLLGFYKCKLYDTREILIKRNAKFARNYVFSACKKYGIKINKNIIDEFISEINFNYLKALDTFNSNNEEKMMAYTTNLIKGSFNNYAIKYINNMKELILNKKINDEDEGELIDLIKNPNDGFEVLNEEGFSKKVLKSLSKLSKGEYTFVMLRFKENYSYEELAEILNVSVEKIIKKEKSILKRLKEDKYIISKVKK